MKDKKLFPELPEDITGLTDNELEAALSGHIEVADRIDARDEEIVSEYSADELVQQYSDGAAAVERIRAEQTARTQAAAEAEASLAEASARMRAAVPAAEGDPSEPTDPDPSEPTEPTEPSDPEVTEPTADAPAEPAADPAPVEPAAAEPAAVPAELEPVAASADPEPEKPKVRRQIRLPRPTPERQPVPVASDAVALTAAAGIRGITPGESLDRETLGRALVETWENTHVQPGMRADVVVASARFDYVEDRQLGDVWDVNGEKIRKAFADEEAVVATGGICATPTPIYDLDVLGTDERPVRDTLSPFQATRGGVNVPDPLSLASVTTAVGSVTAAEDEAGGSPAVKACQRLDCEDPTDYFVEAVYGCVEWGEFGARSWPERVAAFADLVRTAHARLGDGILLTKLRAESTAVTAASGIFGYGASSNLLGQILAAAVGFKSRHRLDPDTRLQVLLPFWARELLVADLRNSQFDRFEYSVAGVAQLLREHGVEPTFYLDQADGTAQIIGSQGAGALLTLPNEIHWAMFPIGTFIFLDQGTLDLGVVRDSTLIETNDFRVFFETFEGLAKLGPEAIWIESEVCWSGSLAAASTAIDCTP